MILLKIISQLILMLIIYTTIKKTKTVETLAKIASIWILGIPILFLPLVLIQEKIGTIPIRLIVTEFYLVYLFVLKIESFRRKIKKENKENKEVLIGKIGYLQEKIGITRKRTLRHRLQQIYWRISKRIRFD